MLVKGSSGAKEGGGYDGLLVQLIRKKEISLSEFQSQNKFCDGKKMKLL